MNTKKYFTALKYFVTLKLLMMLLFVPVYSAIAAGGASVNLSPQSGSYKAGQTFNVVISVNPGADKIDTVRAKLTFPADTLEIKNFSTSQVFSFQSGSNAFDNSAGTFSWGAGIPGGTNANVNFGTITFSVKKFGSAVVALSGGTMVLSAGEDKFNGQLNSASYNLLPVAVAPKQPVKNLQPGAVQATPQPEVIQPAVAQPIEDNNSVDTTIIPQSLSQPQNFTASLMNGLAFVAEFRVEAYAAIILIILLLAFVVLKKILIKEQHGKSSN